jgi:hypothetical protein
MIYFSGWVPIFEEEEKSQESVPRSAGQDRGAALLRKQVARIWIGAYVCEVGVGLLVREWI